MKRVISITICLFLGLPLAAVVADLDGVRGVPWGSGPAQVKQVFANTGAQIHDRGEWLEVIPQSGPVSNERYYFQKGQLIKVSMTYTLSPTAVLDYFSNQYGKPDFEKNAFWWKFPSTLAKIERGESTIWYRSLDITEETKDSTKVDGKDQPDDPQQNINRVSMGMTMDQVIQLMGNPVGKRVGNALSKIIFSYRTGEVVFNNNRVVEVKVAAATDADVKKGKKVYKK